MADFRSFKTSRRLPAAPMQPVVDPAGWEPEALCQVEDWSYKITARDVAELKDGIAEVRRRGVPIVEVAREDFPLKDFADALGDVRRELTDGRGIVMLQKFPVGGVLPRRDRHRLSRARRLSRSHHVAEQRGPRARAREGPRRRL